MLKKLFFGTPPNFTPSAEKRFSGNCDNIVVLRAKIATGSLTY